MAYTQEQIEAINKHRSELGGDTLPLEGEAPKLTPDDNADKDKIPADAITNSPKEVVAAEVNEDAVKAFLASKGITVNSIEDLKPKLSDEEIQKQKEERENKKLTFGLEKGIFKKAEYEGYIADTNNVFDVVFNDFKTDLLKDEPELTEAQIEERFEDEFHQNDDENSYRFKQGKKRIEQLGASLIKNKYGKIFELDNHFNQYETEQNKQKAFADKVLLQAPIFKKEVETVLDELKKYSEVVGENDTPYEFEYPEETITQVKNYLLDSKFVTSQIDKGWTKEELKDIADTLLFKLNKSKIISKIAKDHASSELLKKNMGKKGIIPTERLDVGQSSDLNDRQLAWQKELGVPQATAN